MPAQFPRASFDPISPDFNLSELVEETDNFQYAPRIPCDVIQEQGIEAFEKAVLLHVILGGKPLVVEGFHHQLDQWTFTPEWLRDNLGQKVERSRNLTTQDDLPLTIAHYLKNMPLLANQWTNDNYKDPDRQRIYLKDIDCPDVWHDKLKETLPSFLFYLNETTGDIGGPGSTVAPQHGAFGKNKGRGIARAGDLMSSLPPEMRAENMMCYIGHEGTYTPAHREMCASLGQNIMVEASGGLSRDGRPEKPGSSIWFMTESKDRHLVSEYWLSVLGHDIEVESHFAQVNAWKQAPFTTYIVKQKIGDLILIPPLAPHQVWNRGTRTMKAAWNRTTVETLEMALNEALPRARMVCRDEQYKNKAIVYYTLIKYSDLLHRVESQRRENFAFQTEGDIMRSPKIRQVFKDFKRLFKLYTTILLSEMFSPELPPEKNVEYLPFESNVTCAYCRCNIFNRFLTCPTCIAPLENGEEDNYDVCMECFAMGRSCGCISKFKWMEQFHWKDLCQNYDEWRHQIISLDGAVTGKSPQPLDEERKRLDKKTLAQICQEQLKGRPWRDINKPPSPRDEEMDEDLNGDGGGGDDDDDDDDDGTPKRRRKKRRSQKWLKDHLNCHICKNREEKWKLAHCECGLYYCYGSLFRAFDLMPQTVMENPNWRCPKCLKVCSCGACRKNPEQNPFEPTGTLLGHDTKRIADPRSVESLVDFGHSNLKWLKSTAKEDETLETGQLRRRREEAEQAKSLKPTLDDHYVDDWEAPAKDEAPTTNADEETHLVTNAEPAPTPQPVSAAEPVDDGIPIDPLLSASNGPLPPSFRSAANTTDGEPKSSVHPIPKTYPLPPVSAMLDGAPVSCHQPENEANNTFVPLALDSGDPPISRGLPELQNGEVERDHMGNYLKPSALMIQQDGRFVQDQGIDPNAITYQYPDPTLGEQDVFLPKSAGPPSAPQPSHPQQKSDTVGQQAQMMYLAGQKRKRREEHALVQSDLPQSAATDANRSFQQVQKQRILAEAKKNDRFISAKAALQGKHLLMMLPVSKDGLQKIAAEAAERTRQKTVAVDGTVTETENHTIISSDVNQLPEEPAPSSAAPPASTEQIEKKRADRPPKKAASPALPGPPEKKKKKAGRPPKVTASPSLTVPVEKRKVGRPPKNKRESSSNEISPAKRRRVVNVKGSSADNQNGPLDGDTSKDELDEVDQVSGPGFSAINAEVNPRKRRRQSVWLTRKNQEEDADLPTELPPRTRRKRASSAACKPEVGPVEGPEDINMEERIDMDDGIALQVDSRAHSPFSAASLNNEESSLSLRDRMAEENRLAKLEAARWAEEEFGLSSPPPDQRSPPSGGSGSEYEHTREASPGPKLSDTAETPASEVISEEDDNMRKSLPPESNSNGSISSRPSTEGKDIRIVLADARPATPKPMQQNNEQMAKQPVKSRPFIQVDAAPKSATRLATKSHNEVSAPKRIERATRSAQQSPAQRKATAEPKNTSPAKRGRGRPRKSNVV